MQSSVHHVDSAARAAVATQEVIINVPAEPEKFQRAQLPVLVDIPLHDAALSLHSVARSTPSVRYGDSPEAPARDAFGRSLSQHMDSIVRRLSASSLTGVTREFYCQICMNNWPVVLGFQLKGCDHMFCQQCVTSWMTSEVNNGNIALKCVYDLAARDEEADVGSFVPPALPANGSEPAESVKVAEESSLCNAPIDSNDIEQVLSADPATLERYRRFSLQQQQPNLRSCPYPGCGHMQVGNPSTPSMTCAQCGREYCFLHASAHVGKPCAAFTRKLAREESKLKKAADIKECPKCHVFTQRLSGCAHMQCSACKAHWCWHCGEEIAGGELPAHYAWFNLRSKCAGRQLTDKQPTKAYRVFQWTFGLMTILIFGIPAAVLLVLAWLLVPCYAVKVCKLGCPKALQFTYNAWMVAVNALALFTLMCIVYPLAAVVGIVIAPFYCCYACFRCCCQRGNRAKSAATRKIIKRRKVAKARGSGTPAAQSSGGTAASVATAKAEHTVSPEPPTAAFRV